jgi:deoxyribodipyrimidine photo-lyase
MVDKTICIHIFRRDYRLEDNTTLIEACKTHDIVLPIFIFTKTQIDKKTNSYRSDNCVQFLCASLKDLDTQIQKTTGNKSSLTIFYADSKTTTTDEYGILATLIKTIPNVKTISFNMDYTYYSKIRDEKIKKLCESHSIKCLSLDDICLNPIGTVVTASGKPYSKFTPFWKASASTEIKKIVNNKYDNYYAPNDNKNALKKLNKYILSIEDIMKPNGLIINGPINTHLPEKGGRENGLHILHTIKQWDDYNDDRDMLSYKTTHLSPFNKFGCVSIREVYWAMLNKLGKDGEFGLIRQLFWRDFFYNLSYYYPEAVYKESGLNPKYRNIKWPSDKTSMDKFTKWCKGETGYPIVDACMRELNTTGYMHNRGRLITANFLCRLLHIDWKLGEKYFASHLYDYDPAQNNFGWQVSGANSSGTTSRPLSQTIMNPWIQSAKHDTDAIYIKLWCPELKNVKASHLHKWYDYYKNYDLGSDSGSSDSGTTKVNYYPPMIDYTIEKEKNLKMYKKYL